MKYPDKTILISTQPLFVSLAERLSRDFGRVLLHVPLAGSFPTMNSGMVGTGIHGVEKVDSVFSMLRRSGAKVRFGDSVLRME